MPDREYLCPICGIPVSTEYSILHDHYLDKLEKTLNERGYRTIREGKMPKENWRSPDMFVLRDFLLEKIIEVVVGDPYERGDRSIRTKAQKIKEYYDAPEIIIFEPTRYLDKDSLPQMKIIYANELGFEPESYVEIEEYYHEKWKGEGLSVSFWNEDNLRR